MFPDVDELFSKMFTYHPMTDAEMQISYVNDISEWAEERAMCAQDIMEKCNELKELIAEMDNLS